MKKWFIFIIDTDVIDVLCDFHFGNVHIHWYWYTCWLSVDMKFGVSLNTAQGTKKSNPHGQWQREHFFLQRQALKKSYI